MGRERRFREKCVTSLLYDPLISDGRSGSRCPRYRGLIKRISGQRGMSLYGSVVAAVALRRHTRTLSRGATRSAVQQLRLSAA